MSTGMQVLTILEADSTLLSASVSTALTCPTTTLGQCAAPRTYPIVKSTRRLSLFGMCTATIAVLACGYDAWITSDTDWASKSAGLANIWINGVAINPPSYGFPGVMVAVFGTATAFQGPESLKVFNTFADTSAATQLVTHLGGIAAGKVVVIMCYDDCSTNLGSAKSYIASMCGSAINSLAYRDGYLCVLTKGGSVYYSARSNAYCLYHQIRTFAMGTLTAGLTRMSESASTALQPTAAACSSTGVVCQQSRTWRWMPTVHQV